MEIFKLQIFIYNLIIKLQYKLMESILIHNIYTEHKICEF